MINFLKKRGIVGLPAILLISGIIIEISFAGVIISNSLNNARFSERLAAEALTAARSGAQDAMLRVVRFKNCPSSPSCPASYSLTVGDRTATTTIEADTPSTGQITIQSTGTAFTHRKKIQVILGADATTGEVKLQSFGEVQL